jgi:hypothetical protein
MIHSDQRLERMRKSWKLRLTGKNYRDIAEELGVSAAVVCEDLKLMRENIEDVSTERAKEEREIELARLDAIVLNYMDRIIEGKATNGDVATYIKVSERRSKMLGMDAITTTKTELSGPDGTPLQLSAGNWQQRMIAAGWSPPNEQQVLPGLPQPNQLPGKSDDLDFEIERIEVHE